MTAQLKVACAFVFVAAIGAAGCTKNSNSPSSSTTTTTTTTTVPATTTTTTTTTTVPGATTFTLSGLIVDDTTNQPLIALDASLEILTGPNTGRTTTANSSGGYAFTGLTPGTFLVRARANGYDTTDSSITLGNANLVANIPVKKTPITTTTTVIPLNAAFFQTPTPCTITGAAGTVDCVVDASTSTGSFTTLRWDYLGKVVLTNARINLQVVCSDLGAQRDDTFPVTLTLTDAAGNISTVTKGVVILKVGACGF